jgi:AraC-like DNA-binding protein
MRLLARPSHREEFLRRADHRPGWRGRDSAVKNMLAGASALASDALTGTSVCKRGILTRTSAEVCRTTGNAPRVPAPHERRKTGRSVQRWITERRMAQARRLLRETDLNIETVATSVGYRQPSFRDHTVTPATWRRRTRVSDQPIQG